MVASWDTSARRRDRYFPVCSVTADLVGRSQELPPERGLQRGELPGSRPRGREGRTFSAAGVGHR